MENVQSFHFSDQLKLQRPKNIVCTVSIQCCLSLGSQMAHYPTGKNSPLELMFAKFATAKIAKNLEVFCRHF